jgi:PIN domain nuclease of toxin-antitoxin system
MGLLLDTATFLWVTLGAPQLSANARRLVSDPDNEVYLSAASIWEIVVKHALGRLPLPSPPHEFVPRERQRHEIEPLSLDEASVLQLGKLPGHHQDPFDRMLVCQAIAHGLTLVTPDRLIMQYPVQTSW